MKTDNELIAEFMGIKVVKYTTQWEEEVTAVVHEGIIDYPLIVYSPDTSWDWLMPVVEKITEMYTEQVDQFNKPLKEQAVMDMEYSKVLSLSIRTPKVILYNSVVEFIKWYNSQELK